MKYIYTNAGGIFESVHRLAYRKAFGDIPDNMDVHHTCGNKQCQNPYHLILLSRSEHTTIHMKGNTYGARRVAQIHPEYGLIKIWNSPYDATKNGLGNNIGKACKGIRDTASDCWWMYI